MKHVAGFPDCTGTSITAVALARVQSRRSGVIAVEQIRTKAVSIANQPPLWFRLTPRWCVIALGRLNKRVNQSGVLLLPPRGGIPKSEVASLRIGNPASS